MKKKHTLDFGGTAVIFGFEISIGSPPSPSSKWASMLLPVYYRLARKLLAFSFARIEGVHNHFGVAPQVGRNVLTFADKNENTQISGTAVWGM